MNVPQLGEMVKDEQLGWYYSEPLPVTMLNGKVCRVILDGYDDDENKDEFHAAIANFLSATPAVLREADDAMFLYYKDHEDWWLKSGKAPIKSADELWRHVSLGGEPMVRRRHCGDQGVYVSIESDCDWEEEHGLQIVLKNGLKVNKMGPYDGHLTHSDAYADARLEGVIYRSWRLG